MPDQEQIPVQLVHNELAGQIQSEEDRATMQRWQDEIDRERAEAHKGLSREIPKLVIQPNGVVETAEAVERSRDNGEDLSDIHQFGKRA